MERIILKASKKDLKHSVRFDNKDDVLLKSIYLTREGLIKVFGKDTMDSIVVTIEEEEE